MEKERRRELIRGYKERPLRGLVYAIENQKRGRRLILAETDPQGARNRFAFFQMTGDCPRSELAADWRADGPQAFVLVELEEIEKKPEQEPEAFREDLKALGELWREREKPETLY